MMTIKFNKVEISIERAHGYNSYYLTAHYKGKNIKVHTNDSLMFDYFNDYDNKQKHLDAKRKAYFLIKNKYDSLYQ